MPSWFGNGTGHGSDLIGSTSDIVNPAYRNLMAGYPNRVAAHTKRPNWKLDPDMSSSSVLAA
jgi:hypothetical protein